MRRSAPALSPSSLLERRGKKRRRGGRKVSLFIVVFFRRRSLARSPQSFFFSDESCLSFFVEDFPKSLLLWFVSLSPPSLSSRRRARASAPIPRVLSLLRERDRGRRQEKRKLIEKEERASRCLRRRSPTRPPSSWTFPSH